MRKYGTSGIIWVVKCWNPPILLLSEFYAPQILLCHASASCKRGIMFMDCNSCRPNNSYKLQPSITYKTETVKDLVKNKLRFLTSSSSRNARNLKQKFASIRQFHGRYVFPIFARGTICHLEFLVIVSE